MSLPSFEQLLGSLRIDADNDDNVPIAVPPTTSTAAAAIPAAAAMPTRRFYRRTHRRTPSDSSTSSLDDDLDLEPDSPLPARLSISVFSPDADIRLSRHAKRDRYAPYALAKRVSLPALVPDAGLAARPNRATSTSPLHSVHRVRPLRAGVAGALSPSSTTTTRTSRSGSHSSSAAATTTAPETVPISAFVRRRAPRSTSVSPTAPTFPAAVRDSLNSYAAGNSMNSYGSNLSLGSLMNGSSVMNGYESGFGSLMNGSGTRAGGCAPVAIPALPILLPTFLLASPASSESDTSMDFDFDFDRDNDDDGDVKPRALVVEQ